MITSYEPIGERV